MGDTRTHSISRRSVLQGAVVGVSGAHGSGLFSHVLEPPLTRGKRMRRPKKNRDSVQKMGLSAAAIKTAVFTVQAASYMRLCARRRAFQRCLRRRGSSKNADDRPSCRGSTPKVPKIGRRAADPSARALSRPSLSHYHRSIARQRSNTAVPAGSRSDQNCGLEKAHSPIGQIPRLCLRSPDGGENTAFFPKIRTPVPVA